MAAVAGRAGASGACATKVGLELVAASLARRKIRVGAIDVVARRNH